MLIERLQISGLLVLKPRRHEDKRGYFSETFNEITFRNMVAECRFVQDNQSYSRSRATIRGLHFQAPPHAQSKLVSVLQGSIYDVAVDIRRGSATFGHWLGKTLSAASGEQFYIPSGFAHGYCTLEPETIVAYKVDQHYFKDSEGGVRWDDPDLSIDWPVAADEIFISEKDRHLPRLRDLATPFS